MKKIVIFAYTLDMGGAEKVLIDYLNVLKDQYKIDLFLIKKQGELLKNVPSNINVIQLRRNIFDYALFRYIPFYRKLKINKLVSKDKYDIAIGFIEGRSATWVADINYDIKKIAWIHNDVNSFDIGIGEKEIKKTYSKMNKIITVSEQSKLNFCNKYQINPNQVQVLYNLINEKEILKLSNEKVEKNNEFTFINVGRMRPQKRQDRLIEIAQKLKQDGYAFKIQIIGNGPEEEKIKQLIKKYNVADVVQLLGLKLNPYPYVKQADCFVLTSDFEGFGIVVKESLLLGTPVVSTNVTGVKEVLQNGKFGILCDISTQKLYESMKNIIEQKDFLKKFKENLIGYDCENDKIIEKLKMIIEGND